MPKLDTRSTRLGAVVQYEVFPEYGHCRKDVVVNEATAKSYVIGTVLGMVTATGKYKILEASASDGSQNFAGIYIGDPTGLNKNAIAATTDTTVTVLFRGDAGVGKANLVFGASVNSPTLLAAVYAQMEAVDIQMIAQPAQFGV
jgi:hypothetical protein